MRSISLPKCPGKTDWRQPPPDSRRSRGGGDCRGSFVLAITRHTALPFKPTATEQEGNAAAGTASTAAVNRARQVALPQMLALVSEGEFIQAYAIGETLREQLADDTLFKVAWEKVARPFTITSQPAGATVRYGDSGTDPATFTELGLTPITEIRLSTSPKQFVFTLDGHHNAIATTDNHFFDSITTVTRVLSKVGEIPEGMIRITEGIGFMLTGMAFDKSVADGFAPTVDTFLIDQFEVTNKQYMQFVNAGGYTKREYWADSFIRQGQEIDFAEAMKLMVDTTGRPGPAAWAVGRFETGRENYPVQGVSWYEDQAYANFLGKSLPTPYHGSRANESFIGTDGLGRMVLRSNINKGTYSEVGSYTGVSPFGVSDLCGNVAEWVGDWWDPLYYPSSPSDNPRGPGVGDYKVVRGGSWSQPATEIRGAARSFHSPDRGAAYIGFRCARSLTRK